MRAGEATSAGSEEPEAQFDFRIAEGYGEGLLGTTKHRLPAPVEQRRARPDVSAASADSHQRLVRRVPPDRSLKTEQKKPKVRAGDRIPSGVEVVHQVNALRTTVFASCSWCQLARPGAHALREGRLSTDRRAGSPARGLDGEFDPGSGRTLAACLTHASRTRSIQSQDWGRPSGERVSNT